MDDEVEPGSIEVPCSSSKCARGIAANDSTASARPVLQFLQSMPRDTKQRTKIAGSFCCTLIVVSGIILAVLFFAVLQGDPDNIPASWSEIFDTDPFEAKPPEESIRWGNSGSGLNIQVVNTLDDHWYSYFEKSSKYVVVVMVMVFNEQRI